MQTDVIARPAPARSSAFDGVTTYQWLVVLIASAGWLFDCMDQRIFVLARTPALRDLLADDPQRLASLSTYAGYATSAMILGWATGGIIFGMMSDKVGRVKTMVATLLVYSGFTGLSGLAQGWADFMAYRFLAGVGVGGMFGAATALVAESVSPQFRPTALGILQTLSAVGNIIGSLVSLKIAPEAANFAGDYAGWRVLFFVGVLPALLVVPIVLVLKEPQSWLHAKAEAAAAAARERARAERGSEASARERAGGSAAAKPPGPRKAVGSPVELFRHPRWRRNTLVGLFLGVSGMIGLWGIGFYSPELIATALRGQPQEVVVSVRGWATALQDVGAFLGMIVFTAIAASVSRRLAFLGSLVMSMVVTMFVFNSLTTPGDAYWMLPLMGFAQLSVFAGYSIYFPELFPTRLRGTGVGFCYNTVRYLAAPAPALFGLLATAMTFRTAAMLMATVYLVGVVALLWAPETKGQPLPEDS